MIIEGEHYLASFDPGTHKRCTKCKTVKLLTEFHGNVARPDNKNHWCKPCQNANNKRSKEYKKRTNPEAWRRTNYDYELRKAHNMTIEDYDILFAEQDGKCKICKQPSTKFLSVDHEHSTGLVRGLLCNPCNLLLGNARDNPETLRAAALYLEDRSDYHVY